MILKVSWDNIDLTGLIARQVEFNLDIYLLTYLLHGAEPFLGSQLVFS